MGFLDESDRVCVEVVDSDFPSAGGISDFLLKKGREES
jgi:hypothetical protein